MTRLVAVVVLVFVFSQESTFAQRVPKEKDYDLSSGNISGDIVRGPRRIVATHLNVLRYNYRFNSTISFSQTPDLWSQLATAAGTSNSTPPPPAQVTQKETARSRAAAAPGAPRQTCQQELTANKVNPKFTAALCNARTLAELVQQRVRNIQGMVTQVLNKRGDLSSLITKANCETSVVAAAGRALTDFLKTTSGDPEPMMSGMRAQLADGGGSDPCTRGAASGDSLFISGTKADWINLADLADLQELSGNLKVLLDQEGKVYPQFTNDESAQIALLQRDLQSYLDSISSDKSAQALASRTEIQDELDSLTNAKSNLKVGQDLLTWATQENNNILAALPDLAEAGQKYTAFRAARDLLNTWKVRMLTLYTQRDAYNRRTSAHDPFSMGTDADCEFAFSRTKTTAITLTRTDQLPGTTTTNPESVLSVSVECTSPFTVSAGVAFSTIGEHEFAIQPVANPSGSTTTTNEFVSTAKSSFHPLPIGIIHARPWEPREWLSVHASFGMAGNFNSQSSGGSSAEFLMGPSFSFFRTMFLTPGLHIGRQVSLGAGFKVGDPAPSNITTPPLQKSYVTAFGVAITFTKP